MLYCSTWIIWQLRLKIKWGNTLLCMINFISPSFSLSSPSYSFSPSVPVFLSCSPLYFCFSLPLFLTFTLSYLSLPTLFQNIFIVTSVINMKCNDQYFKSWMAWIDCILVSYFSETTTEKLIIIYCRNHNSRLNNSVNDYIAADLSFWFMRFFCIFSNVGYDNIFQFGRIPSFPRDTW